MNYVLLFYFDFFRLILETWKSASLYVLIGVNHHQTQTLQK